MKRQSKINSQCQNDLEMYGFCTVKIELNSDIHHAVMGRDYQQLDKLIAAQTQMDGIIFETLKSYCDVKEIEFIISLREAINPWEEDGIWHDDGSRIMAFSLSLTSEKPEGGVLEFRKKGAKTSLKIPTPDYGTMIIFKTGIDDYEHKINQVTKGHRLIIAGWCYP